jgi:cytochrome P450
MEAVIHESMRLKPVAPILFFEPNQDVTLGDLSIPRGTPLLLATRFAHLREEHLENAERFMPERWLSEAGTPVPRSAFVPFGGGPRLCPGRSLALLEMKMALTMLCRSFTVERASGAADPNEVFSFTLAPANVSISLRPRAGVAPGL